MNSLILTPLRLQRPDLNRMRRISIVSKKCVAAARKKGTSGPMGFVAEDNSGRSNIFAVEPRTIYTSSPTSERAASTGLGGAQGLLVVAVLIGFVAISTLGVANSPQSQSLSNLGQPADSLSTIVKRLR